MANGFMKKRLNNAVGGAIVVALIMFILFICTSMGFLTFLKWGAILSGVAFLWGFLGLNEIDLSGMDSGDSGE